MTIQTVKAVWIVNIDKEKFMFIKFKKMIFNLARNAVIVAESELGSGNGALKKQNAIRYVAEHLPVSPFVRGIICSLLSRFIDDAIEIAVEYMNSLPKERE